MIKKQKTNKTYNVPSSVEKTNKKLQQTTIQTTTAGRTQSILFYFPHFYVWSVSWMTRGWIRRYNCFIKKPSLKTLNSNDRVDFNKFKFVSVLKPVFLSNLLCRVLSEHKWSRKQKQQNRSWTRLCWCIYLPVHTKICIALKIWSVSNARALHIPNNKSDWTLLWTVHMLCFECQRTY